MANLLGQNIGTNYKGILNLDTINTPLDATLRAVTDGEGNASPLQLSADAVSIGAISGARLGIKGSGTTFATNSLLVQNSAGTDLLKIRDDGQITCAGAIQASGIIGTIYGLFGGASYSGASVSIKGSSTTASTTALLVQDSAGTNIFRITDDGAGYFGNSQQGLTGNNITLTQYFISAGSSGNCFGTFSGFAASAIVQCESTTRGFLPPRMTTTQKNAIAAPASGLIVYDSTTNKLACYNGTTWNDLF